MLNWPQSVHIAIHAMAVLSHKDDLVLTADKIADALGVSVDHLSKVLQRLSKMRLLQSTRGPKGGYSLSVDPVKTPVAVVYEAMEGKLKSGGCAFHAEGCGLRKCVFGGMLNSVNEVVSEYMRNTMLADIAIDISEYETA